MLLICSLMPNPSVLSQMRLVSAMFKMPQNLFFAAVAPKTWALQSSIFFWVSVIAASKSSSLVWSKCLLEVQTCIMGGRPTHL